MHARPFVDPDWQEAATLNARKGYPWAVWVKNADQPLILLSSCRTESDAHQYAARIHGNTKGKWITVVVREPV